MSIPTPPKAKSSLRAKASVMSVSRTFMVRPILFYSLLFSFILFYSLLFFSHGNDTTLSYTGSGKNILVCWFFSVIIQRRKILRLYNRMKPNRNSFLNPRIWHLCKGIVKNALHTWRIFVRWDIYKELTFPFSSFVSA